MWALGRTESGYRDKFMFLFGINTGLRISDILALKVGQVRGKEHVTIKEQKTKKLRTVELMPIVEDIEEYTKGRNDEEWLFPSRKGNKPITKVQAYRVLRKASETAGLDHIQISTHTMRKTFGYWHYQVNKDIAVLQEILNHKDSSTTRRYIGIAQDEFKASYLGFRVG
jgi:integrase